MYLAIDGMETVKNCENKPLIEIDRTPWYRGALQRMGLQHEHETFGERNIIEDGSIFLKQD